MKTLLRIAMVLLLTISVSVGWMVAHESDYIYFPDKTMAQNPHVVGLSFRRQIFTTADGVPLHGWYMPHRHARFTLLHLHGNAGNISDRLAQYRRWHDMGLAVFAFDYRGYGLSSGAPSEEGLYADARAAWVLLTGALGIPPENIIIAGRSLGSAVASHLATQVAEQPAGLALEVPFTSIPDMSGAEYPWLPLRWFVHSRFDNAAAMARIKAPLLILSADHDEIIPDWMAGRLVEAHAQAGPLLQGRLAGGHNDFDARSEHDYRRIWLQWLSSLSQTRKAPVHWVLRNRSGRG